MAAMSGQSVVFVHGAGGAGPDAWPLQARAAPNGWFFLPRIGPADDVGRDAGRILDQLRVAEGGHVVAHSYGANTAVMAAQLEPSLVWSLALLEPACFDLARGMPAVESHIAAMTPVFEAADDPLVSTRKFSARFAAAMGAEPPHVPDHLLEAPVARLRAMRPPWGHGLESEHALPVRTLVLTSGRTAMYEEAARALEAQGARHLILDAARHRIQDHPQVPKALRDFWDE